MTAQLTGRDATLALIERIAAGENGEQICEQVANWHPEATQEQIAEAFQEACAKAARACRGQTKADVYVWLRKVTAREVVELRRHAQREPVLSPNVVSAGLGVAAAESPEELLIAREEQLETERLTLAVLDRLSDVQRHVAALHGRGHRRHEIAAQVGISPRMVKRAMESILKTGRAELVRYAGRGCADGWDLVARFAFGIASSREQREAQLHLMTCPDCGAMYERLDGWRENVAALTPVPAVEQVHPGAVEQTVQGAGHGLSRVRDHVVDALGHVKQQLAGVASRAVDPTPLAGTRPGAAAAALAGCLAIGTGATYCVKEAANPVSAFTGIVAPAQQDEKRPEPRAAKQETPTAPEPAPTAPTTVATTPAPPPQPTPQPEPKAPPALPPAPEDEFEPTSPVASTASSPTPAARDPQPAPVPEGSPGEFEP